MFVEQLCCALARKGHTITVIAPQTLTKCLIRHVPVAKLKEKVFVDKDRYYTLIRPKYFSVGNLRGFLKKHNGKAFKKAAKRGFKCVSGKVDEIYGHFWQSVLYTSFFIRALYGFVQVYAQRYVSPLNVVMIFSSELVMTLFLAPFLANRFGVEADEITFVKVVGSIVLIFGLLMIEPEFIKLVRRIRNVRN